MLLLSIYEYNLFQWKRNKSCIMSYGNKPQYVQYMFIQKGTLQTAIHDEDLLTCRQDQGMAANRPLYKGERLLRRSWCTSSSRCTCCGGVGVPINQGVPALEVLVYLFLKVYLLWRCWSTCSSRCTWCGGVGLPVPQGVPAVEVLVYQFPIGVPAVEGLVSSSHRCTCCGGVGLPVPIGVPAVEVLVYQFP